MFKKAVWPLLVQSTESNSVPTMSVVLWVMRDTNRPLPNLPLPQEHILYLGRYGIHKVYHDPQECLKAVQGEEQKVLDMALGTVSHPAPPFHRQRGEGACPGSLRALSSE